MFHIYMETIHITEVGEEVDGAEVDGEVVVGLEEGVVVEEEVVVMAEEVTEADITKGTFLA
jgi:hypothetical protein